MGRLIGIVVVLATVGIGYLIFGQDRAERDTTGAVTQAGEESVLDLASGDCITSLGLGDASEQTDSSVRVVPCSGPHVFEIYASAQAVATTYDKVALDLEANALCEQRFEPFVGIPIEQSTLAVTLLSPTPESWGAGDRLLSCVLHTEDQRQVSGTFAGAAR